MLRTLGSLGDIARAFYRPYQAPATWADGPAVACAARHACESPEGLRVQLPKLNVGGGLRGRFACESLRPLHAVACQDASAVDRVGEGLGETGDEALMK